MITEAIHGEIVMYDCCAYHLGPVVQDAPDLTYRRCQMCGCRHFRLLVHPGMYGLTLSRDK